MGNIGFQVDFFARNQPAIKRPIFDPPAMELWLDGHKMRNVQVEKAPKVRITDSLAVKV